MGRRGRKSLGVGKEGGFMIKMQNTKGKRTGYDVTQRREGAKTQRVSINPMRTWRTWREMVRWSFFCILYFAFVLFEVPRQLRVDVVPDR